MDDLASWRRRLEDAISYARNMPRNHVFVSLRKSTGQEVNYSREVLERGFRCALNTTVSASDLREALEALTSLDETASGFPAMRLAREWLLEAWNA